MRAWLNELFQFPWFHQRFRNHFLCIISCSNFTSIGCSLLIIFQLKFHINKIFKWFKFQMWSTNEIVGMSLQNPESCLPRNPIRPCLDDTSFWRTQKILARKKLHGRETHKNADRFKKPKLIIILYKNKILKPSLHRVNLVLIKKSIKSPWPCWPESIKLMNDRPSHRILSFTLDQGCLMVVFKQFAADLVGPL